MIQYNESIIIGDLTKSLRLFLPTYITFRHEDRITSGHPDISTTGDDNTTWIEGKFANPEFKSKGIQELTMLRLAKANKAIYVVWEILDKNKFTYIVDPKDIGKPRDTWENLRNGFDHQFVADQIRQSHLRGK